MIGCFKITWKTHVKIILGTYLFTVLFSNIVNNLLDKFFMNDFIFYPTKFIVVNFYIYVLLLLIPISIVHECIHGLAYRFFGGKVKFGFKFVYAYTQEISGRPIRIIKFLIVLLLPLIVISIICVYMPVKLGSMIYLLNLLGSSGDIYMALTLSKYNKSFSIVDKSYGYDVLSFE